MVELSIEHILLFVIIAFLLYHFVCSCECTKEGFSIGINCDNVSPNRKKDCTESYNYCFDNKGNPIFSKADETYSCEWVGDNSFNRCALINNCAQPTFEEFPESFEYYWQHIKDKNHGFTKCKDNTTNNNLCDLGNERKGICFNDTCYERGNNCTKPIGTLCPSNSKPICSEVANGTQIICGHF